MPTVDEIIEGIVTFFLRLCINNQGTDPALLKISQMGIEMMHPIWNSLSLIGFGLTTVYFIAEINKIYAFEGRDMNIKSFLRPFLKYAVAIIVLMNSAEIISTFLDWHNSFITYMDGELNAGSLTDPTGSGLAHNLVNSMGTVAKVLSMIFLCPTFTIGIIMSLVWDYKAYGYQFEMIYRIGITPFALADIYSGTNSNAIKWLKGFFGLLLYGLALFAIPRLGVLLYIDEFENAILALMDGSLISIVSIIVTFAGFLLVPIAELGVLGIIKQTCKEACG